MPSLACSTSSLNAQSTKIVPAFQPLAFIWFDHFSALTQYPLFNQTFTTHRKVLKLDTFC